MSFTLIQQATPRLHRSELAVPGSNPSLFEKAAKGDDRPAAKAWLLLHMGDLDQGFRQLDLAVAQHDPAVGFLLAWPGIGHVRADPRYEKVLERLSLMKFADVWRQRSAWR